MYLPYQHIFMIQKYFSHPWVILRCSLKNNFGFHFNTVHFGNLLVSYLRKSCLIQGHDDLFLYLLLGVVYFQFFYLYLRRLHLICVYDPASFFCTQITTMPVAFVEMSARSTSVYRSGLTTFSPANIL